MTFIADLHIHSHFSRATARNLVPRDISVWAQKKGIAVVGTGDLTHEGWISELQESLVEAEEGLYRLNPEIQKEIERDVPESCRFSTRFLLSGEISCIYKRGGRTRKVHNLVLMPDFDAVTRLNDRLNRIGNLKSDGRPILGLDSRDLLEIVLEASDRAFFIPAHIWTPWFSLFGSKSGFDAIEECFDDLTPHIHALETGLSSDPPMNRLLSALDPYLLVSNSDAHSPAKLGREANVFDTPMGYDHMRKAMISQEGFEGTVEFFPEEGKYHYDGHRKCEVCLHPREALTCDGVCPECGKPMTLGVLHRIEELADRSEPRISKPFYSLIPLTEIISEIFGTGPATKRVTQAYDDLLSLLGPELYILMEVPLKDIERAGGMLLAEAVDRMRQTRVIRQEGYDGEYGVIRLFEDAEREELAGQMALFGAPSKKKTREKGAAPLPKARKVKGHERATSPVDALATDPLLDTLNPSQREAVTHNGGHLLITAGPGTGKTLTLTRRIAYLLREGIACPDQILALTFTNKAAREMAHRIETLLLGQAVEGVRVSTFHRFCLEILREEGDLLELPSGFILCPEPDAFLLAQRIVGDSGQDRRMLGRFVKTLPALKRAALPRKDPTGLEEGLRLLFDRYQEKLRGLGMLDLDDLEVETLRLFLEHPETAKDCGGRYPFIFVDEYQDTNPTQVEILKALVFHGREDHGLEAQKAAVSPSGDGPSPPGAGICAIGDPDQAIYGFRGADVREFYAFGEDFPGGREVVLLDNYRSTQRILRGAAALMEKAQALQGHNGPGDPILLAPCRTPEQEAETIVEQIEKFLGGTTHFSLDSGRVASHEDGENLSFGDIAVLFRLNAQGDALEDAFSRSGIPYVRSGERPIISRYPVNVLWRFLQAVQYPRNPHYRETYLGLPEMEGKGPEEILAGWADGGPLRDLIDRAAELHAFKDLGEEEESALRRLKEMGENFEGDLSGFLDVLSLDRGIDHAALLGDRTALMSLHAAKGLEWPVVFITGCEEGLLPCTLFGDRENEEERRLFYVGMTRARQRLILSHASRRALNGRILRQGPSPFLSLIPDDCAGPLERAGWKRKKKPWQQLDLFTPQDSHPARRPE
ncbi:MAG: UvrD-helicase domain-containing protein [Desulfatiglandales bacterium]